MSDLVDAGLMMKSELEIIEALDRKFPKFGKYWMPIVWAASLANRAREEGRIRDDFALKTIVEQLAIFRSRCGTLLNYNTVCIPLVYTQVVTIAVYTYLLIILIGMQNVNGSCKEFFTFEDIPFLTTLQFLFYLGWLKVAETMLVSVSKLNCQQKALTFLFEIQNPFGDDDDDFEVNSMIDRNIQMAYLIVDEMHQDHPELLKDQFWNEIPTSLPDRSPADKRSQEQAEPNDFFDVKPSMLRRRSILPFDIESATDSRGRGTYSRPPSFDRIPQASIIDKNYQNKPDVIADQSLIESQMETIKSQFQKSEKSDEDVSEGMRSKSKASIRSDKKDSKVSKEADLSESKAGKGSKVNFEDSSDED